MNTMTATEARTNLFNLLKQTVTGHLRTRITSKEGSAILISENEYEGLLESAQLLTLHEFKDSIEKANRQILKNEVYTIEEAFE